MRPLVFFSTIHAVWTLWSCMRKNSSKEYFKAILHYFRVLFTLGPYNGCSMNVLIFFFVALGEVQVAVFSVLNLPRQGFLATCRIEYCCVCSPLLFAQKYFTIRQAIRRRTVNRRWIKWAQVGCHVAWKPKMQDDVKLNGVFRICLWLVARQLRIPNR